MRDATPGTVQLFGRPCAAMTDGRLVSTEILPALSERPSGSGGSALTEVGRAAILEAVAMAAAGLKVRLGLGDGALADPTLPALVARALAEHGARPNRLVFKIADTHLGRDDDGERGIGDRLADFGCELSLERFSCGYGAFSFLKAKPVSYLAVDGAYISALRTSTAHQQTATAVVNLAKDLGIRTIATKVGDEAAMRRLRAMNVDLVEGDFIGLIEPLRWRGHDRAGGPPVQRASPSALESLRRALDGDEFMTQFEPTVDLRTGRTLRHELSLEIREQDGHRTAWADILAVAERFGLSTQLDGRLAERAVELVADGAAVALGISTASLVDPDFSHRVAQTVLAAGVDPALLRFELREEGIRASPVAASAFVHRIHALGCPIAVSDVGADLVDLGFLKRLPVDAVKLDIGLTSGPPWIDANDHVVRAVAQLAHDLGMTVGAQGVCGADAPRRLENLGVDHGQGPLFGVPAALGADVHAPGGAATGADHGA